MDEYSHNADSQAEKLLGVVVQQQSANAQGRMQLAKTDMVRDEHNTKKHITLTLTQAKELAYMQEIALCGEPAAWRMLMDKKMDTGDVEKEEGVFTIQGVLVKHNLPPITR